MELHRIENTSNMLNQASQPVKVEFCPLRIEGDSAYELYTRMMCRDYFNELLLSSHIRKDLKTIYGFKAMGKDIPIPLDYVAFSIYMNEENKEWFKENLDLLVQEEQGLEVRTTIMHEEEDCIVVIGDKFWVSSTISLAYYTVLLRTLASIPSDGVETLGQLVGLYGEEYGHSSYIIKKPFERFDVRSFIQLLYDSQDWMFKITEDFAKEFYDKNVNMHEVHDMAGIVSFTNYMKDGDSVINGTKVLPKYFTALKDKILLEENT